MSTADELACVYAALILHDEGVEVTSSKIATVTKAAGIVVEPFYPTLFAKFLESRPLGGLLTNVGSAPAGGEAAPAAAAGGDAAPAEEKKAAPKVESEEDEDMGFGLFD